MPPLAGIHQTRRVVVLCPVGYFFGFELAPSFIERYPYSYARIVVESINDLFPFFPIGLFAFGSALQLFSVEVVSSLPFGVFVAAGHIPPDDNAFAVAVGVPCGGFYLDMLTYHVVAPVDGLVDVVYHRLVRMERCTIRRGHHPWSEKPVVKQVFVVELEAHHSFVAHLRGNLTHGCVTVYFIESLALVGEAHFKIIKMGAVGDQSFTSAAP